MAKRIFLIFIWLIINQTTWAQENKLSENNLSRLLSEREQLVLKYQYYNQQNSNFWGKKSKKDLLNVIESLKQIINKDSEIIKEINVTSIKKQAITSVESNKIKRQVVDDNRVALDNIYELRQEMASLRNVQKVKQQEFLALQEKLKDSQKSKQDYEKILIVIGGICVVLFLYIWYLRSKVASLQKKPARRK